MEGISRNRIDRIDRRDRRDGRDTCKEYIIWIHA
jgi:hypothetical protein